MFKGRFGDFYLVKVWALTVFVGPFLSTLLSLKLFNKGEKIDEQFFVFIFLEIVYGLFLSFPSLIISDALYKVLTKSKLKDKNLFYLIILLSLITTLLTYYFFLEKLNKFLIIFSLSYSAILIFGFFYFKSNKKHQLTTDKQNI